MTWCLALLLVGLGVTIGVHVDEALKMRTGRRLALPPACRCFVCGSLAAEPVAAVGGRPLCLRHHLDIVIEVRDVLEPFESLVELDLTPEQITQLHTCGYRALDVSSRPTTHHRG